MVFPTSPPVRSPHSSGKEKPCGARHPHTLVGVDGCPSGWVAAIADPQLSSLHFQAFPSFADLLTALDDGHTLILVDIPIGLAAREPRACDLAARHVLGHPRGSSVFPAPTRSALHATSYLEVCELSQAACGRRISRQLFGILPKIREVDQLITPNLQTRVRECHPEVTFALLAVTTRQSLTNKRYPEGNSARLALLSKYLPPFNPLSIRQSLKPANARPDDILDAAACLVSAHRLSQASALILPKTTVEHDECGLRMEIVA